MDTVVPKVSVVMSVYNGSQYLKEAIDSILNQTFRDFEFIIINDASTDNSRSIIGEYASQDQRIKILDNKENVGLTKSLNKGLRSAKGCYIARQDADDISLPNRFEKQVSVLDLDQETVLVSSDIEVIDAEGKLVRVERRSCHPEFISWYLNFYNHIGGHSQVIFRRDAAIELKGYSESCRYSQDYEFWCRLDKVGKLFIIPEVLIKLRRHGKGITAEKRADQLTYSFQQSNSNIKRLINRELSLEELSTLKKFWSGHIWGSFPDSRHAANVHALQVEVYHSFIQKESDVSGDEKMDKQLKILIGQQFIAWIGSLSMLRQLSKRIEISYFALHWNPVNLVFFWLKEFYTRVPLIMFFNYFRGDKATP